MCIFIINDGFLLLVSVYYSVKSILYSYIKSRNQDRWVTQHLNWKFKNYPKHELAYPWNFYHKNYFFNLANHKNFSPRKF